MGLKVVAERKVLREDAFERVERRMSRWLKEELREDILY